MRYTVEAGDCKVEIEISSDSPADLMRAVEESAARLLVLASGSKTATSPKPPFGYSLSADIERAEPQPEQADDNEP